MNRIPLLTKTLAVLSVFLLAGIMPVLSADAVEELRYSCSAQVYEAFGKEAIKAFERKTGILVDTHVTSSKVAVSRLMMDFSDIAGATRPLAFKRIDYGYVQTPFCKDYLAIIVNAACPVNDISSKNLKKVFSRKISNWKELGGMDQEIFIVIPSTDTGAFKNFDSLVMSHIELRYDFLAYKSTIVIDAVRYLPDTISFISYGAALNQKGIKILSIDGRKPGEKAYPYGQTFSYVTRGKPTGAVKKFIDFTFTEEGKEIIKRNGMDLVE
ncbi:MAG: substrate-binding domain-containing protein [Desulfobacterales bacterium]